MVLTPAAEGATLYRYSPHNPIYPPLTVSFHRQLIYELFHMLSKEDGRQSRLWKDHESHGTVRETDSTRRSSQGFENSQCWQSKYYWIEQNIHFSYLSLSLFPRTTYLANHFHYSWCFALKSSVHIMKLQSNSLLLYTEQKYKRSTFVLAFFTSWSKDVRLFYVHKRSISFYVNERIFFKIICPSHSCCISMSRQQGNCARVPQVAQNKIPF